MILITILSNTLWRIVSTRPFDSVRPRILHSNVFRLEGKTKCSNSNLSMVVFGRNETAEYFSKLIYVDSPELEFLGERVFSDIPKFAEKATEDFFIVEANWPLSNFLLERGFLILPQINFTLDISDSLEMIQNRMYAGKIRRIKRLLRAGYLCETTKDPAILQSFYHEMYLPHMLAKHGRSARPVSFSECRRLFLNGDLLLVKQDKECIAGIILVPHGEELYQPLIAVKDIDGQMTMGSYAAAFYTIVFGKQNGYTRVDFGDTHPFLQDGLFQYKREWGMRVRPALGDSTQVFGARFLNVSEGMREILSANPFIFLDGKDMKGLVFCDTLEREKFDFLNIQGLTSFVVISPYHGNLDNVSPKLKARVLDGSDVQTSVALSYLIGMCHRRNWTAYEIMSAN